MNKKVVLVNSEWLDIPMALKWLSNKGYEVICFVGNLVQKEDLDKVEKEIIAKGTSKVYKKDLGRRFITNYLFLALYGKYVSNYQRNK